MLYDKYNTISDVSSSTKRKQSGVKYELEMQSMKNNLNDCEKLLSYMEKNLNEKHRFRKPKNRWYTSDTSIMIGDPLKRRKKALCNHNTSDCTLNIWINFLLS